VASNMANAPPCRLRGRCRKGNRQSAQPCPNGWGLRANARDRTPPDSRKSASRAASLLERENAGPGSHSKAADFAVRYRFAREAPDRGIGKSPTPACIRVSFTAPRNHGAAVELLFRAVNMRSAAGQPCSFGRLAEN
jgi:hypothetical protein